MRNHRPTRWLLAASVWAGCGGPARAPETPAGSDRPLVRLGLERTACFGFCPEYQLGVSAEGQVTFRGIGRWDGIERTWSIPADSVTALAGEFAAVDFFGLRDITPGERACGQAATDHPSIVLTASDGQREHQVHYYAGCPGTDTGPPRNALDRLHNPPGVLGALKRLAIRIDSVTRATALIDSLQAARRGRGA
jgi:hypothetical protein